MGLLSLDRLTVVRVTSSDIGSVGIVLWATGIVLGGVIALVGLMRKERHAARVVDRSEGSR